MTRQHFDDAPRTIAVEGFPIAPSCVGFGCASLGSRVGARAGLRALEKAFDAGVTWFDVAPAYGAGEAERHLAGFLRGRRDKVVVTTKAGVAPPRCSAALKMAQALARPVVGMAGGLRRTLRRTGATRNRRLDLTGVLVRRSIEDSLRRLGTDHVDVFALHDPDAATVERDDVLRALEDVLQRGQARRVAVAGSGEACRVAASGPFTVLQTSAADLELLPALPEVAPLRVTHSVFGVDGPRQRLLGRLSADPRRLQRLLVHGYDRNPLRATSNLLLDAAFATNPCGIVLSSMFAPDHLAHNLARAGAVHADAPALLAELLG